MVCNCMKKSTAPTPLLLSVALEPNEWGPLLWNYLHRLAEHIGLSGSAVIDTDQAGYMEVLIGLLPLIVPCTGCQEHAADYLVEHPLPTWKGLYGAALRMAVREWLFDFHQAVRIRLGQPVIVAEADACAALYSGTMKKCEYMAFIQSVGAAVRIGKVRMDAWKKWYSHSERLRIIAGNFVV